MMKIRMKKLLYFQETALKRIQNIFPMKAAIYIFLKLKKESSSSRESLYKMQIRSSSKRGVLTKNQIVLFLLNK